MPCYYPIAAYRDHPGGRVELYAREQNHLYATRTGQHFTVPCGKCSGCRRTSALNWATRCMHEAQRHTHNSYITLTYDDKHLPKDLTLRHRDFQLFIKRLRKAALQKENQSITAFQANILDGTGTVLSDLGYNTNRRTIRYYMAGEYGERYGRPHFHAIIFGLDFADRIYHSRTAAGAKIYQSETLDRLWGKGYASIGDVTFASAAYIARYVMKKRTGDGNKKDYEIIDPATGEIYFRTKEYNEMSRRPGLGKEWFDKHHEDYIFDDKIRLTDGRLVKPPRYYDKQLQRFDREIYEHTKITRQLEQIAHSEESTPERLAIREIVDNAKARRQTRNLE